ncbi:integrase core domain-containing protein [Pseudoalteromonas luteoviolacea]|uniref:integrase core domain-containing protein n=1 Tax=Pseudoalteromonas luteoviolacea TaxID=43657 RepID=UPI0009BCE29E|nr:integrase core domain-containing protein [Pseudoalteromonas luteoviolacea]MBQ4907176.1 integrase core domain-containing protein [Pseudoalteromonas luteoviolacea]
MKLEFIKPSSPYHNGFVKRFNRSYREDILDLYLFESLQRFMTLKVSDEIFIIMNGLTMR